MKFDFIIGNPPYHEEQISVNTENSLKNFAPPVYHAFLENAYSIANKVEMIHPARFLFDAGYTPKVWNHKMLNDSHLTVPYYEPDSDKVFPGLQTPIKGGVCVTYRDIATEYGAIEVFTHYPEVNTILHKVITSIDFIPLTEIVFPRTSYRLTKKMHEDNPTAKNRQSKGHLYDMSSNIFSLLPEIFYDEKPNNSFEYIKIIGRENGRRIYKYIRKDYVNDVSNTYFYKILIPQATGEGIFGETFALPFVEGLGVGSTETFISMGAFSTKYEADNLKKYICSKFARTLLSVLKVTQNGNKPVWRYIPLQNFTSNSDIDWNKSIREIDLQLYSKYGLTQEEVDFIETNVKEMA